jgi:hypothetical protein
MSKKCNTLLAGLACLNLYGSVAQMFLVPLLPHQEETSMPLHGFPKPIRSRYLRMCATL